MSSEFQLIDSFLRPFGLRRDGAAASGVLRGPGDDCAVLQPGRGLQLVATTDAAVEGVHFRLDWSTPQQAGHKALAMNLSDLAAAGARPRWFLCALGVPRSASVRIATGLATGMARLAAQHGVALVGGNVTAAPCWSVTITALGEARRALTRAGARPGDVLLLCGRLGDAALGLRQLQAGVRRGRAVTAQRTPVALVTQGLAAARFATAAVDVSDGLLADLGHLCRASGVGAELDAAALPHTAPLELALAGGEDYALLFAVPPRRAAQAMRATGAVRIGVATSRKGIRVLRDGKPLPLPARAGHDHLD